jgi:hypothetical protein
MCSPLARYLLFNKFPFSSDTRNKRAQLLAPSSHCSSFSNTTTLLTQSYTTDHNGLPTMSDFPFETFPHLLPTIVARFAINSTNHPDPNDPNAWVPYRYVPSLAGAIVFIVCFLITTAVHCWQMAKFRSWFFVPFVIGGFSMHAGMYETLPILTYF